MKGFYFESDAAQIDETIDVVRRAESDAGLDSVLSDCQIVLGESNGRLEFQNFALQLLIRDLIAHFERVDVQTCLIQRLRPVQP